MCTIDKMLIKGIRSFSPDNNAVITFFKPLTLIVGPNGAGKTTIIECLKNACTGELPPNSRSGHTFIHDPKVAGETETKAQIKLRFKTSAGKDVVCIRSFQLSQKASKMEYKAIESVLQTINSNTGEKVCLSYRCADMDREVPALMGVSKAILENVIFVHQDDANWPLAEGAVLKKKFDDIFSATRYTKALEVIKKLHKEQSQLIKEYKLKMENLQTLKNSANKLQENIDSDKKKAEHLENEIKDLDGKMSVMNEKIFEIERKLSSISDAKNAIRIKESKKEMVTRQRLQQYNDLEKVNEDTDEELYRWQSSFESSLFSLKQNISKIENELMAVKDRSENEKSNYNNNTKLQARLQAEAEANLVEKAERDTCLKRIYLLNEIGSFARTPISDDMANKYANDIMNFLENLEYELDQLKEGNRNEIERINSLIGKSHANIIEADGRIELLKNQKQESLQTMKKIQFEIQNSSVPEHQIRQINDGERSVNEDMEALEKRIREQCFEECIEERKRDALILEQKIKALQKEKDEVASESAEKISLRMKKGALNQKTQQLNQIMETNMESFRIALDNKIPGPEHIFSEICRVIQSNANSYSRIEDEVKATGNEVAALSMRMKDLNGQINLKKKEIENKKYILTTRLIEVIQKEIDIESMEEHIASAQSEMNRKKRDHDLLDGMRRCFNRFIEIAEETHKCPVCERHFSSQEEHDAFTKRQKKSQSESGEKLQKLASQRAVAEGRVRSLEQLRPIFQDYQKLSIETLPSLEKSVNDTRESLEKATEHHDDLIGILAQMESEHEVVKKLEVPSREMDRLIKETESLHTEIKETERRLDGIAKGGRSIENLNSELSYVENQRNTVLESIDKLRVDQQKMKDEYSNLNVKWRRMREEKLLISQKVQKHSELKSSLEHYLDQIAQIEKESQDWERRLSPLRDTHKKLSLEMYTSKEKANATEEKMVEKIRNLQRDVDKLKSLLTKIEQFQSSGKDLQLKEIGEKISKSLSNQKDLDMRIKELTEIYDKEKQFLQNQNVLKRNIDDNINYRKTLREEKSLEKEILVLHEKVKEMGNLEDIEEELNKMRRQVQEWLAEQNRSRGAMAAYEGNIKQNLSNLRTPQYKDIHFRFKSQFIQLKTTELANKDLDKYYTALDRALMRFHAMKMEEINSIIRELWQQTYRSQDIDYIQLRSDAEGTGTRSYSYRVVMKSGDAELDMRGRCSAGQKVLASLIIRLALAETFCLNCGILALDEPTTNLDYPNSQSLASALQRIMEERRNQENFQLIVITHDENFAQMIGQRQHAEHYFRISKDENQHSRIEMQGIMD